MAWSRRDVRCRGDDFRMEFRLRRYVEQRADDDCLRACLASLLDLDYDAVPPDVCAGDNQHNRMQAFLAGHGLVAWTFALCGKSSPLLLIGSPHPDMGGDGIGYHLFPTGLWLASVRSPRNDDDHVVVMQASKLLWDPHPRREMGHNGFTQAIIPMPRWAD